MAQKYRFSQVDRAAAGIEMGDLVFACATAASDLVAQHTCLNEYTICQTDQQCMDQIDAYYRDPATGLFRSGSAGTLVPSLSWLNETFFIDTTMAQKRRFCRHGESR